MPVSHEQKRDIIRRDFEPTFTHGTFYLDDRKNVENDDFCVFAVVAREFLVDGVYKEDGRAGSLASVAVATDPTVRVTPNPAPTLII